MCSNTVVSNHFHSVKILLFSSARSRDFDGLIGIELPKFGPNLFSGFREDENMKSLQMRMTTTDAK
jgi:hypothetical protein